MGAGVGVAVDEDVAEADEVGVGVIVTLKVVGRTVVNGTLLAPDRVSPVDVNELVVRITEALAAVGVEEANWALEFDDWAFASVSAASVARIDSARIVQGLEDDGKGQKRESNKCPITKGKIKGKE